MNTREIDKEYVAGTYKRFPVEIVSGKGSVVCDPDGKQYIDMGSGIGVTAFGIADEQWKAAVTEQLSKVQHMSNLYYTQPCALLAKMLCEKTGMSKVFFSNSGAEANECAIKVGRKYASDKYGAGRFTVITLENSFHGRTLTTLAATGQEHYHELFQPLTPGFVSIPANKTDALEDAIEKYNPAAVMIECIQGEGGVVPLDAEYIRFVREITQKNDIIMIVDEVQTGNGRTGRLYSYMNFGIVPDVVSTAKGLGGGLPLGATLISDKCKDVLGFGDHGSTFGGNPVSCAAALSVISRLTDSFLSGVESKAALLRSLLEGAPGILSVSGMGLMLGLKTVRPAAEVVQACMENGVLCLTAKDKVRLLPALNIPMELLEKAVAVIKEALK
jgi:acetylornithine/N-succinyldiaminopimelate aminotransferase